jgi:hypothetical protein
MRGTASSACTSWLREMRAQPAAVRKAAQRGAVLAAAGR